MRCTWDIPFERLSSEQIDACLTSEWLLQDVWWRNDRGVTVNMTLGSKVPWDNKMARTKGTIASDVEYDRNGWRHFSTLRTAKDPKATSVSELLDLLWWWRNPRSIQSLHGVMLSRALLWRAMLSLQHDPIHSHSRCGCGLYWDVPVSLYLWHT